MKFKRITVDSRQMGGVPCIRGLRIPVATVVGMVADGLTHEEILRAYPAGNRQIHISDLDHLDPEMIEWPGLPHARAAGTRTMCGTPLRRCASGNCR